MYIDDCDLITTEFSTLKSVYLLLTKQKKDAQSHQ